MIMMSVFFTEGIQVLKKNSKFFKVKLDVLKMKSFEYQALKTLKMQLEKHEGQQQICANIHILFFLLVTFLGLVLSRNLATSSPEVWQHLARQRSS